MLRWASRTALDFQRVYEIPVGYLNSYKRESFLSYWCPNFLKFSNECDSVVSSDAATEALLTSAPVELRILPAWSLILTGCIMDFTNDSGPGSPVEAEHPLTLRPSFHAGMRAQPTCFVPPLCLASSWSC